MDQNSKNGITRRDFIKKVGKGTAAVGLASVAPRIVKPARAAKRDYILIGHPNPSTGPLADFGEVSPWSELRVIDVINKQGGIYIKEYGKKIPVKIKVLDTESSPTNAGEVASRLILHEKVDLVIAHGTPDVANPVSAICERYEVPCICGDAPYEPWLEGGPYKWSSLIFWTVDSMTDMLIGIWDEYAHRTNKVLGGLWPNDPDGIAWSRIIGEKLPPKGYKVVDPGRFPYFMKDFTSIISLFKKEKVEILTGELIAPDFVTAWRQMRQQGFIPKIASAGKATIFPSAINALGGDLPNGLIGTVFWSAAYPFRSAVTGESAKEVADAWEKETGKQSGNALGPAYAVVEVAFSALKRAQTLDKAKIQEAVLKTDMATIAGHVRYDKNNFAETPLVGGQWVKGKKWPWELKVVFNKYHTEIPKTAELLFPIPR